MKRLILGGVSVLLVSGFAATTASAAQRVEPVQESTTIAAGSPRPHTGPTIYDDGRYSPENSTTIAVGSPRRHSGPTIYNDGRYSPEDFTTIAVGSPRRHSGPTIYNDGR